MKKYIVVLILGVSTLMNAQNEIENPYGSMFVTLEANGLEMVKDRNHSLLDHKLKIGIDYSLKTVKVFNYTTNKSTSFEILDRNDKLVSGSVLEALNIQKVMSHEKFLLKVYRENNGIELVFYSLEQGSDLSFSIHQKQDKIEGKIWPEDI